MFQNNACGLLRPRALFFSGVNTHRFAGNPYAGHRLARAFGSNIESENHMKTNYHTHTYRCNHAAPNERQYVEAAVRAGFSILGFADHVPQPFRGDYYSGMRMHPEETADYVDTVRALKHEFRGEIDIHVGFEAEYYPALFADLLSMLEPYDYEYLILGQHFLGNEQGENYLGVGFDDEATLRRYVHQCAEAMATGAFTYFAHPDIPHFTGSETVYRTHMRALCREAKISGVPLEINLLGMTGGRHYPSRAFWEEAAAVGNKVILGWDAHAPEGLSLPQTEEKAAAWIDELGLARIDCPALRAPHGCRAIAADVFHS